MNKKINVVIWNLIIFSSLLVLLNIISWGILCYKDNAYKTRTANLPAMINKNYIDVQDEWYKLSTDYRPFIAWRRHSFTGKYINIDEKGIRKTTNSEEGRVVRFFGGSTMWGARVEDRHTIPSWFGVCNSDSYKIINYGETGYNARQELALLTNIFLKKEKTDLVIFYDGVNDINHMCNNDTSIPGHMREQQFREKLMTKNATQSYFDANDKIYGLSKQLLYKTLLANTVKVIDKALGNYITKSPQVPYTCHIDKVRAELVANNLLECWKVAYELAHSNGSEFIAILQPNVYLGNAKSDYLKLERSGLQGENFKAVYEILNQKIQKEKLDWIYDFTSALDNTSDPLYYDFCHLNEKGNQMIANKICELVTNQDKVKE